MIKVETHAVVIVKKEDREHKYFCSNNSGLGEIFDVLTEMRSYIAQRIQEEQEKNKANEAVDGNKQ